MSRDDRPEAPADAPAGGEFHWVVRTGRPAGTGPDEDGPSGPDSDGEATPEEHAHAPASGPRMTAGLRAVWAVCWVGSAVGLGLASARLVGVSAALLGPRAFGGLLAGAAFAGVLGSILFGFGLVACYWVVKRERRGFGALSVYLAAVAVAGVGALDPPAGYLALAVPVAGLVELAYNRRQGYFDGPAVPPADRVGAALGTDDETPGRHPRSSGTAGGDSTARHRP